MVGVGVLGAVELWDAAGREVLLGSLRQRRLLAALTLHAGQAVDTGVLTEHVWGDSLPANAGASLHTNVARLRRRLPAPLRIETTPGAYRLVIDGCAIDVQRFRRALDRAERSDDPHERLVHLEAALAMWRGRPYADLDDSSVAAEVARLTELELSAQESRASALMAVGSTDEAIAALKALTIRESMRERPVALLMEALVAAGRQGDALRAYGRLRRALVDELGVDPSPMLQGLQQRVLRQEQVAPEPPVASSTATPKGSLPPRPPHLFGRSAERASLALELTYRRLVTLTGVGGVGKTSLAIEVAAEVAARYRDGIRFCDLAQVHVADAVVGALATMLGAPPQPGLSLVDSVADELRDRHVLVILDNCEHVLAGVAQVAERVMATCPDVTLLATSREPLHLPGERIWTVNPLVPELEAAELFRDRAAAADAAIVGNDELVADVCSKLDGIPLAIELAAARLRTRTLADLADGLDDRLRLLRGPDRRATERHRTLTATIAWSHQLLTDDQRRCFDRLAVFAGSFDAAAADEVCDARSIGADDISNLLGALVDKSMVVVERGSTHTRYRLLETLRQYAEHQLAERHELHDRRDEHLAYFVGLAERTRQHDGRGTDREARAVVQREWDNLRGAFQWAMQRGDHTAARRLLRALYCSSWYELRHELGQWAEQLLAAGDVDAFTAGLASCFLSKQGEMTRARVIAEAGIAAPGPRRGDGPALCWFTLAEFHWTSSGRMAEAWSCAQRAYAAVDDDGDSAVVANAVSEAAFIGCAHGLPGVEAFMSRLERLATTYHDRVAEYCVHLALGLRAMSARRPQDAVSHYRRALDIAEELGTVLQRSVASALFAFCALVTRMPDHLPVVRNAIAYLHQVRDNGVWGLIEQLAIRWTREGRLHAAAVILGHLERHNVGHASLASHRRAAVATVVAAPEAACWLQTGAQLSRDELFDFALAELDTSAHSEGVSPASPAGSRPS
jgi:predicted ATPase/DNA-binding SARP family transcriptional activator